MEWAEVALIAATAVVNAAVTLAVVRVELRYLRRDVDHAHRRLDALDAPHAWHGRCAPE